MPFKSHAQQRFMFMEHPQIAKRWAKETDFADLPEHVKNRHRRDSIRKALLLERPRRRTLK